MEGCMIKMIWYGLAAVTVRGALHAATEWEKRSFSIRMICGA